jgi:hypothetical protein
MANIGLVIAVVLAAPLRVFDSGVTSASRRAVVASEVCLLEDDERCYGAEHEGAGVPFEFTGASAGH